MADIRENNVSAENQVTSLTERYRLGDPDAPVRLLILGNSITLHGEAPGIGWFGHWGMAASSKEKDYVHRLYSMMEQDGKKVYMSIRQIAHWERNHMNPDAFEILREDVEFRPDVVLLRFGENVPKLDDPEPFYQAIKKMIAMIGNEKTKYCVTDCFWKHESVNPVLIRIAEELGAPLVHLGDLGKDDRMMAIGKFEHHGVSVHPGDLGMEEIAKRIYREIGRMI